jgi:hypothetical protein
LSQAVEILYEGAGKQFEPDFVRAFVDVALPGLPQFALQPGYLLTAQ